ncbi:MAG: TonB-dependent receptor [Chitinophagaceae bacterium]|nr:TonB-dependent receptor [Chitinophagaceae bacterium]
MRKLLFLPGLFFYFLAAAQISGRVVNSSNQGIPFASVTVKGSGAGTSTDSAGHFTLPVNKPIPFVLQFSSVGYEHRDVLVKTSLQDELLIRLMPLFQRDTVVITSRRRKEVLQDVPIPVTVIGGAAIDDAGAFNVTRIKELIPSVQMYTSNPRNTGVNIRGTGSPFGLTNDGLDPGVGFYIDGVYFARPAVATLDFIDVERVEVLRGPQGTLFGKNTTSGAFNITTRKPAFKSGAGFETSYGNYGFIQAKASVTGPLSRKLAARFSFSGTQRDGTVYNKRTDRYINDINNLGLKTQFLYNLTDKVQVTLSGDYSRQRPEGYAQVVAGVVPTKRAAYRQFNAIIADLNYTLPSQNAFDRIVDHDTPWKSGNELGGGSVNIDARLGGGTLTSTTAYRFWNWDPSNDRDFTGLQALAKSQNPAKHRNWSQEIRYAGELSASLSGVAGLFFIGQEVNINGTEESGSAQWRFSKSSTSSLWETPGLFDGYGISTKASIKSFSAAAFVNADWQISPVLHVLPGLRINFDKKDVSYNRTTYGGLITTDPALIALKNAVYTSQQYVADADETNLTGNLTVAYKPNSRMNAYATYSTAFKPVGVNVAGLPSINGQAATQLAVIKPEYVQHLEAGVKTSPAKDLILNLTFFQTEIRNYQTNVQSPELGVNRGYIANAEKVRIRGGELETSYRLGEKFSFYGSVAYTNARYVRFTNAPLPLEETGNTLNNVQVAFKDISGGELPGISPWSFSTGAEYTFPAVFLGKASCFYLGADLFYRSGFSSSPSPSAYLNIEGYELINARFGFKTKQGLSAFIWVRNLLDRNYHEQLLPAGGNAGHYASVLGDPRMYGITLRYNVN